MSDSHAHTDRPPRTLAGATVLQIVPALHEAPVARTAIIVARALVQSGARAIVASEDGPLVAELESFGGEWKPLVSATANPFRLRRAARELEQLIGAERVDIVHAHSIGAAWSANRAAAETAVWRVTSLPDAPPSGLRRYGASALARADRIITPSNFAAAAMVPRYSIPRERLSIVPRSIDVGAFDAASIGPERITALRRSWRTSAHERILLVPGRVAPWNGQLILAEVARTLLDTGVHGFVFVLAGEHRTHRKYARLVAKKARAKGVGSRFRLPGHCRDLPAAFAAADTVVFPAIEPPVFGRAVAQAQAIGRPVVTSDIGILPEQIAAPPELPDDVRTGWAVKAGDATAFAEALRVAFSLDDAAYRAMAGRARQFARYMFAPESVAAATCSIYRALLERQT